MKIVIPQRYISFSNFGFYLVLIGMIYKFIISVVYYLGNNSLGTRFSPLSFIMLAVMVCFFLTLIYEEHFSVNVFFIRPFSLYIYAIIVTILSFMYSLFNFPFVIINMTYWIVTMYICFIYVRNHGIPKWLPKVAFITLVVCFICFLRSYKNNIVYYMNRELLMNSIYYVIYLLPLVMIGKNKITNLIALLLCLVGVLISDKRGALLMIVLIWAIYLSHNLKNIKGVKKNLYFVLFICFGFLLYFLSITIVQKNGINIFERSNALLTGEDDGSGRFEIWSSHFETIESEGFFKAIVGRGYRSESNNSKYYYLSESHNDFIQILFDYGVVGLIGIISVLWSLGAKFVYAYKENYKNVDGILTSVIIFAVGSMGSMCIIYPYWFIAISIFWGIVLGDLEYRQRILLTT